MNESKLSRRENAFIAYRHGQPEFIPCMYTDFATFLPNPWMERYVGGESGLDAFGCEWTFEPGIGAHIPTPGKYLFTDISEWREKLTIPDLESVDWEKQADVDLHMNGRSLGQGKGPLPYPDGHSAADGDKVRQCVLVQGIFERLHACMGFENALVALMTDPDECYEFFGAIADFKIEYIKKIAKYYPADVVQYHDDYGTATGLFMNPELWRRLLKPHLKRIVAASHECGLIHQEHSCGFIETLIPDLVEIGVDALDPMQACNTRLAELKREYGDRLTFCGGFDNQHVLDLPGVAPEAVKAEYRRAIDALAPGGSYIVFPTGAAGKDFFEPFLEEHLSYGMNFYK